jgi:hypothetical protein
MISHDIVRRCEEPIRPKTTVPAGRKRAPFAISKDFHKIFTRRRWHMYTSVVDPVRPNRRKPPKWWVVYAATVLVCLAVAISTGTSEDSRAWHAGAIIVILGIVAIWRISEYKL